MQCFFHELSGHHFHRAGKARWPTLHSPHADCCGGCARLAGRRSDPCSNPRGLPGVDRGRHPGVPGLCRRPREAIDHCTDISSCLIRISASSSVKRLPIFSRIPVMLACWVCLKSQIACFGTLPRRTASQLFPRTWILPRWRPCSVLPQGDLATCRQSNDVGCFQIASPPRGHDPIFRQRQRRLSGDLLV